MYITMLKSMQQQAKGSNNEDEEKFLFAAQKYDDDCAGFD